MSRTTIPLGRNAEQIEAEVEPDSDDDETILIQYDENQAQVSDDAFETEMQTVVTKRKKSKSSLPNEVQLRNVKKPNIFQVQT